jgi:predicted RNase H-like HicB family nuclease
MFAEYIQAALEQAEYEIMEEGESEPYYAHVPDLPGVWATGKTLEDCRKELISVIEGWIALRLRLGDPIPPIGSHTITASSEPLSSVQ